MVMSRVISLFILSISLIYSETREHCNCEKDQISRAGVLFGQKTLLTLKVKGMSCEHCSTALSEKLLSLKGVTNSEIRHEEALASLSYDGSEQTLTQILNSISNAGYTVHSEIIRYHIDPLNCENCVNSLKSKVSTITGIIAINSITPETGMLELSIEPKTCKLTLKQAIQEKGFQIL